MLCTADHPHADAGGRWQNIGGVANILKLLGCVAIILELLGCAGNIPVLLCRNGGSQSFSALSFCG